LIGLYYKLKVTSIKECIESPCFQK
jgi:hypothetical protein